MKNEKGFAYLVYSRIFRSVALIFMTLGSPLYLALLNLSITEIGLVYVGVMVFTAFLSVGLGMLGDRFGYKKSLILGEIAPMAGAVVLALSQNIWLVGIGVTVAGISGVAGGMRGAFSPGMTAFTASTYPNHEERVKKLGTLVIAASVSSVFGAMLLLSQSYIIPILGAVGAFRVLFGVAALMLFVSFLCLFFLEENPRPAKSTRIMKQESMRYMMRISALSVLNGAGMGLSLPLLPLMFAIAFKLPADTTALYIGIIYIPSYIATAIGSNISRRLSGKLDVMEVASVARMINGLLLGFLGAIFFMQYYGFLVYLPLLAAAAFVYSCRSFAAGFGSASISAVSVKGIHGEDYGTATSIQGLAGNISQASSGISGYLAEVSLPAPLFAGAILQVLSGYLYPKLLNGKGNRVQS